MRSLSKSLMVAGLIGVHSAVGLLGAQKRIVERSGHGKVFSQNVSRETLRDVYVGEKKLNQILKKTGAYGGESGKAKMELAEARRVRRRGSRIRWARNMHFSGKMMTMYGYGWIDRVLGRNVVARLTKLYT